MGQRRAVDRVECKAHLAVCLRGRARRDIGLLGDGNSQTQPASDEELGILATSVVGVLTLDGGAGGAVQSGVAGGVADDYWGD